MASFDGLKREGTTPADGGWKRVVRWLRRRLPMGLYARSILIVVIPMVLLQSVVAFVFMERHWQLVTQRLSSAVTNDIAAIVDLITTFPREGDIDQIVRIARDQLDLNITVEPGGELPPPRPKPFFEILDQILSEEISDQIGVPSGSIPSAIRRSWKSASSLKTTAFSGSMPAAIRPMHRTHTSFSSGWSAHRSSC